MIKKWIFVNDIKIPIINSKWFKKDYLGMAEVRLGINRFNYKIPTGIYAIGTPTEKSPLIVSCNYKLTFDLLRRDLEGLNTWILILDTKGINVWCAAGKGTFSTKELLYQLNKYKIKTNFKCGKIIVPQLGAVSMEPHLIRRHLGIEIIYGPVRSSDLKEFIENNYKASNEMRKVKFFLKDRLALIPLEIVNSFKYYFVGLILLILFNFIIKSDEIFVKSLIQSSWILIANGIGTILFPILLPYLPFSYFSLNGLIISLPISLVLINKIIIPFNSIVLLIFFNLLVMWESYLFTGCTTFTSLSGVQIETKFIIKTTLVSSLVIMLMLIGKVII